VRSPKWRTTSIGKGVKRPKSPNMRGLSSNQKAKLRNKIKVQKDTQRTKIREARIDLKKIENASISLAGLNQLSKKSIKRLQDKREISMMRLVRNTSDLMVTSRKISNLEKKFIQ
jgi:hypothetical protein